MKRSAHFRPAWWLPGPHLQTIWPTFARAKLKLPYRRQRFELTDGDFLSIDWLGPSTGPVVVVCHGVSGNSNAPYMKGLAKALVAQGWRAALVNFRGCGGEHNLKTRAFHAGDTVDIQEFIVSLRKAEPDVPVAAVGFSMGGNVLLKWLGETRHHNPLLAAAAISVPFNIAKSEEKISKGFSNFYQKFITRDLRNMVLAKFKSTDLKAPIDLAQLEKIKHVSEFNELYVAPQHGFLNRLDYYERTSCAQYLKSIARPTLILHAENDPFLDPVHIPHEPDLSEQIILEVSKGGGHVGFISGRWPWKAEYWVEHRIVNFLRGYFS